MKTLDRSQPPTPGPVRRFEFPAVERNVLPNGLTVLTAQHGSVPLATARIVLDAGVVCESAELAGLAHLVAHTIDTGTTSMDARQLSWALELMGAQLEVATGYDSTAITVTAPAERMPSTLELLARIVLDARFPEAEVQRVRTEQLGEIEQRRSDPRALASDEAVRFIYGADTSYGRPAMGNQASVERLTVGDVRSFYHDYFAPERAALVLVGALDDETRAAALRQLGSWQSEPARAAHAAVTAPLESAVVHIVDRPGSVQSEIRIGHPGPARSDPDYFPLQVMNSILGGAFTSRLNMNLREKQGFTYGVRSSFTFRRGPGPFLIATAVASDVTARAIEETLREVDALRAQGPSDEEMNNTRDYLSGILPLELQTTRQVATKLSEIFIYGLPDDFFRSYRNHISAVTRADTQRVAERHIQRDRFTYVVVGDAEQIAEPLRTLGLGSVQVHTQDD